MNKQQQQQQLLSSPQTHVVVVRGTGVASMRCQQLFLKTMYREMSGTETVSL